MSVNEINAKEEFIYRTKEREVICAFLLQSNENQYHLKEGYTIDDYNQFLNDIDFIYDSGYGGQKVYGCIWYVDKSWSERGEYDGSEWWEFQKRIEIPIELRR